MILGIGLDVVDLAAFAEQLAEPGTAFARVFTARERREARARAFARRPAGGGADRTFGSDAGRGFSGGPVLPSGGWRRMPDAPGIRVDVGEAPHLAVRWAAKEAFVKAWSAALYGSPPVLSELAWHEVEVVSDAWHRPRLAVHGEVARALAESLGQVSVHVSLSHDGPVAAAQVVIEA